MAVAIEQPAIPGACGIDAKARLWRAAGEKLNDHS
jgi:hypothetical protein